MWDSKINSNWVTIGWLIDCLERKESVEEKEMIVVLQKKDKRKRTL